MTRSSEILPEISEYERTSTTVVNAYVGPAIMRYLGSLVRRLREAGIEARLDASPPVRSRAVDGIGR